ncbi:hypothetical protein C0995_016405 [Termitomyces sp. Mi166|nr:hypothetical protein C0995_016405 [Termitomyces sp. Mi166\
MVYVKDTNAVVDATPALADMMHDDELVSACISTILFMGISSLFGATFFLSYLEALPPPVTVAVMDLTLVIDVNSSLIEEIKADYKSDLWCANLVGVVQGIALLICRDGLWFLGSYLMVPYLCMECLPQLIPPLLPTIEPVSTKEEVAQKIIERLQTDTATAQDNLVQAKIQQAAQANKGHRDDMEFSIRD